MKLLIALGALAGCAHCSDDAILYMLGGEAIPACPSDHDNQAILYVYGGSKAHQFKVTPTHEQGDDEIISYLFGGTTPAEDKQVDDMVAFLYGGDYTAMTEGTQTPDVDTNVAKFMLGATTQAAVHTPPAGTSFVKDDVALVERSRVLEELTEWSPSQTYSKAQWMLEESNIHFTDDQLALYMLSGSTTESDNDVHEISDVLFGSTKLALTSVQIPSDVDLVDQHRAGMERRDHVPYLVELVELAEAADSDLATYMLGGDDNIDNTTDDDELIEFLFGSPETVQSEKMLEDLVDQYDSVQVSDVVSLVDRLEKETALFHLGGDAVVSTVPQHNYAEDLVILIDRVDTVDTKLALFLQGGEGADITSINVAGPSGMEEDDATIAFLYDSPSIGAMTATIRDIYGASKSVVNDDTEAMKFLYGASESQPQLTIFNKKDNQITDDNELALFLQGGDASAWSEDEETILFMLGKTVTVEVPVTAADAVSSDSLTPVEQSQPHSPRPYTGEESEDCSDHECISRTLQSMQADLGLSDMDLEEGMIWGEDMVEYCQWQMSEQHPIVGVTSRMPALPSSYSILRPPSVATCKQVLKPAPQMMLKSG